MHISLIVRPRLRNRPAVTSAAILGYRAKRADEGANDKFDYVAAGAMQSVKRPNTNCFGRRRMSTSLVFSPPHHETQDCTKLFPHFR